MKKVITVAILIFCGCVTTTDPQNNPLVIPDLHVYHAKVINVDFQGLKFVDSTMRMILTFYPHGDSAYGVFDYDSTTGTKITGMPLGHYVGFVERNNSRQTWKCHMVLDTNNIASLIFKCNSYDSLPNFFNCSYQWQKDSLFSGSEMLFTASN